MPSTIDAQPPSAQPRALGSAMLAVAASPRGTELTQLRQAGSMKLVFPRSDPPGKQAVLVNTAGGVTGGDRFSVTASAGPGAHLVLTTQAAERAYRAQPGETGRMANALHLADGARLDWLPQETILFEGASLHRSLRIDMADTARLLAVEPLIFGRVAHGEIPRDLRFRDRIEIRRGGKPLFLDATAFDGDATAHLARPAIGGGAGAMAILILAAPEAEAALPRLRAALPKTCGASLIRAGLLVARLLAPDGFALRQTLVPVLNALTGDALPRPWMI